MNRWVLVLVLLLWALPAWAGELKVEQGVITSAVTERVPADALEKVPESLGRVFCFTKIVGAEEQTSVSHVWKRDGVEAARVKLPVKGDSWRVYSSKIITGLTGAWAVEVVAADGTVLSTLPFTVE